MSFERVYVLIVVRVLTTGASFCKSHSDLVDKVYNNFVYCFLGLFYEVEC